MDYQCLFSQERYDEDGWHRKRAYPHHALQGDRDGYKRPFYSSEEELGMSNRLPVRMLQFKHFDDESRPVVEDGVLTADGIEDLEPKEAGEYARLRFLLSPPRIEAKDQYGRPRAYNPEAPNPFIGKSFHLLVNNLQFHKACISREQFGQVSRINGPGVTSFYIETYSYRNGWYKLSVSYSPMTTSVFLHNLSPYESHTITQALLSPAIQPLTLHPMLVPTLVFELLFKMCIKELNRLLGSSINTEHALGLNNNALFRHFKNSQMKDEEAAEKAFGDGQALAALEERMEFNIMLGKKLLTYFDGLSKMTPEGKHKLEFETAGDIVKTRLEYLVDGLEFQRPRLRRTKTHTELNRTGLESRTATQANKISYQIALESKADSSAMKAIAVLTMFFLPATFVAAFFAMPLFDWDAQTEGSVVKTRFWIYWAVTVPGTVLVLLVWRAWWKFTYWNQHRDIIGETPLQAVRVWVGTWGRREGENEELELQVVEPENAKGPAASMPSGTTSRMSGGGRRREGIR